MEQAMEKVERTVKLDPDAAELLVQLAGSPRKQGAFLSDLIRAAAASKSASGAVSESKSDSDLLQQRVQTLEEEVARLRILVERFTELDPPSAKSAGIGAHQGDRR